MIAVSSNNLRRITTLVLLFGLAGITPAQDSAPILNPPPQSPPAPVSESTPEVVMAAPVDLLAGQWSGYWISCKNGHRGRLKATFCRLNATQVQAVFVGSFAKILPFRYRAVLDVVHEEPGMIQLRGSQRLGPIMGTFSYEATITPGDFKATYRSRRDCGQWNMQQANCCQ